MAYTDFKSYIQANYKDMLEGEISSFVNKSHDGMGFHSVNVLSLCDQKVANTEIKSIRCHDDMGPLIKIDINLTADILLLGLGTKKYEADRKKKWFTVTVQARLQNGLHDMTILAVEEYFNGRFDKEDALDEYLIPYIYAENLEDIADDFTEFYCSNAIYDGWQMPISHILQEMGIEYYRADLLDDEFGRMYFRPAKETVEVRYFYPRLYDKRKMEEREISPGTMLISKNASFMNMGINDIDSPLNTIAHEIIHWEKHQKFFEILVLLNQKETKLSCKVTPDVSPNALQGIEKAIWWAEWQANALAPRILMPRMLFNDVFTKIIDEKYRTPHFTLGDVMEDALIAVAKCFGGVQV